MSTADVDTSAAFLDTCVLLNYTLDETDDAQRLFDRYTEVGKVTSENGREEFNSVCNRRREVVEALKQAIEDGEALDEIDITELGKVFNNDKAYYGELLADLDEFADDDLILRLNEELNILDSGSVTLFEQPDHHVIVLDIPETDEWGDLHDKLVFPVGNSNDQDLLCDATEWHKDGGAGTFISEDKNDITEADNPSGNAGTVSDFSLLGPSGGPDDINLQIKLAYSDAEVLDILTTREFLTNLE